MTDGGDDGQWECEQPAPFSGSPPAPIIEQTVKRGPHDPCLAGAHTPRPRPRPLPGRLHGQRAACSRAPVVHCPCVGRAPLSPANYLLPRAQRDVCSTHWVLEKRLFREKKIHTNPPTALPFCRKHSSSMLRFPGETGWPGRGQGPALGLVPRGKHAWPPGAMGGGTIPPCSDCPSPSPRWTGAWGWCSLNCLCLRTTSHPPTVCLNGPRHTTMCIGVNACAQLGSERCASTGFWVSEKHAAAAPSPAARLQVGPLPSQNGESLHSALQACRSLLDCPAPSPAGLTAAQPGRDRSTQRVTGSPARGEKGCDRARGGRGADCANFHA